MGAEEALMFFLKLVSLGDGMEDLFLYTVNDVVPRKSREYVGHGRFGGRGEFGIALGIGERSEDRAVVVDRVEG